MQPDKKGIVQIYTGNGKGKTTAAIGQAFRALGHGHKVCMIQFMKTAKRYGELHVAEGLDNFEVIQTGRPCPKIQEEACSLEEIRELQDCDDCLECFVDPDNPSKEDFEWAKIGLATAREKAKSCDMLILDEIIYALNFCLIKRADVINLIKNRPASLDIILTGRDAHKELVELADLVTNMDEVKHHLSKGIIAREGIEY